MFFFSDRLRELSKEVAPWISGYKDMGDYYFGAIYEN